MPNIIDAAAQIEKLATQKFLQIVQSSYERIIDLGGSCDTPARQMEGILYAWRQQIEPYLPQQKRPKVVVLSGSSRFVQIMAVCAWLLERDEGAIAMGLHLLPHWYSPGAGQPCPAHHLAEKEGVAPAMDQLHLRKIDLADEVFVVNFDHYIGDSTRAEIEYAQQRGVPLRWFTDDRIGEVVAAMLAAEAEKPASPAVAP